MRQEKNITQRQLAKALNINPTLISHYENGTKKPSQLRLESIVNYLKSLPDANTTHDFVVYGHNSDRPLLIERHTLTQHFRPAPPIVSDNCMLCGKQAPFILKDGRPYLERHHIVPISEGGENTLDNIAFLCPNCHRRIHILQDPSDIEKLKQIKK